MLYSAIDHLVVAAFSLPEGVKYVHQLLGITPQMGGEHPRMGTHNALMRLGDTTYLEVIAINPDAQVPDRPRWFELDQLDPVAAPRLLTWVARTNDIHAAAAASPIPLGVIEPMSRGALSWLITIPSDGTVPFQGIAPSLIQWKSEHHPTGILPDMGCSLLRLEGYHPACAPITEMQRSIGFVGNFSVFPIAPRDPVSLVAHIWTPNGMRVLGAKSA